MFYPFYLAFKVSSLAYKPILYHLLNLYYYLPSSVRLVENIAKFCYHIKHTFTTLPIHHRYLVYHSLSINLR